MKRKIIALACVLSLICTNVSAFAEVDEAAWETAVSVEISAVEQTELKESVDDLTGEESDTEKPTENSTDEEADEDESTESSTAKEPGTEKTAENLVSKEPDEEEVQPVANEMPEENAEASIMPCVLLLSEDSVDKTELLALLEEAKAFTEELLGDGYKSFQTSVSYAQGIADDDDATEGMVADGVSAVTSAIKSASMLVRNKLYELLKNAGEVDKMLVTADSYEAFESVYNEAKEVYWDAESIPTEINEVSAKLQAAMTGLVSSAKTVILSGNVKTDEAKAKYPGEGADDLPKLSYKYLGGDTYIITSTDSNCNKLLEGLMFITDTNHVVYNAYGTNFGNTANTVTEILFDMGEAAYVSGVDIWDYKLYSHSKVGLVEVWLSDNAEDYTYAGKIEESNFSGTNTELRMPVEFAPKKCRFIKLRIKRAAGAQQFLLNEVVIHGYRCTQEGTTSVYLSGLDYKNGDDERIVTLKNENEVKVSGQLVNNTGDSLSAKVMTAAYADGALLDLDIKSVNVGTFDKKSISVSVDIGGADNAELYTYVWDNLKDMNVLAPIVGFGLTEHKTASFSADEEGAEFDTENLMMRAWGTAEKKSDLCDAALLVLRSGVLNTDTETMSDSELENAVLYVEQATPDDSGKYGFEFIPYDVSTMYGNNNAYIKRMDAENASYYRLLFFDDAGEKAMLKAFSDAKNDAVKMREAVDTYEYVYAGIGIIDNAVAKYGEETVRASVSSMLTEVDFADSEDVVNKIIAATALTDINNLETKDEVIAAILDYSDAMEIDDNGIFANYYAGGENEDYRNSISDNFVKQNYASVADFEYDLSEVIVLDIVNNVANYSEIKTLLSKAEEYLNELGFDYTRYNKLSEAKKKRVQQAMASAKGSYTELDSVKTKFNDKVKNPGEDKTYGDKTYSGGGSTGGSGGGLPLTGVKTEDIEVLSDLGSVLWAKQSIIELYKKGIASGVTKTEFAPNDNVTREQFAKLLVCAFDIFDAAAETEFADVDEDAWYAQFVASARARGIISGISDKVFGIGENITRQDMAVMAYNTIMAKADKVVYDKSQVSMFSDDSDISDYAREAVYAMRGLGIMQGRGNNAFEAKAFATRAEAAKIIYAMIGE